MPCLVKRNVDIILGQTGSGKTTLQREIINSRPRAFILDAGFQEFSAIHFTDHESLREYLDTRGIHGGNFRASYTPLESEYATMFGWARQIGDQGEELTLVLEECDRFPTVDSKPAFEELVTRGRHYGVHIGALSTYPFAVNPLLRRQATRIFSFRQNEPRDLEWLSKAMSPDALSAIQELNDYEYVCWTPRTRELIKGKTKI